MSTTTPTPVGLSSEAAARLEADLPAMLSRVLQRGRVRRAARATLGVCAVALVCSGAWWLARPAANTRQPKVIVRQDPDTPVPDMPAPTPNVTSPTIAMVSTDNSIVERLSPKKATSVQTLDDASLRAALASAGKPAGLIRVGGKTIWEGDWAEAIAIRHD